MNDIVFREKLQSTSNIEDDFSQLVLIIFDSGIEIFVMDSIHFLIVVVLAFKFIQGVPQRISTLLIQNPSIFLVDEVVVQLHQVLYARTICELLFGSPTELEEICSKPNLFYVSLMTAFSNDLLDRVLLLTLLVLSQPDQTETSPAQELNLVKTIWEAISECLNLIFAHVVRILFLLLPFQFNLLERIFSVGRKLSVALVLPRGERSMLGGSLILEVVSLLPRRFFALPHT